jgi:ribose transport system permease protein
MDSLTSTTSTETRRPLSVLLRGLARIPPIYYVLAVVLIWIGIINPNFYQPITILGTFLKPNADIILVSMGQMLVIVAGELDLSVGALISVCAAVSAKVINGGQGTILEAFAVVFAIATVVGLLNGFLTTRLKVPSFVTTLGMWLIAQGTISIITRGVEIGNITDEFRVFGRNNIGDTGIPIAVVILVIIAVVGVLVLHFTTFGRRLYAVGSNPVAAQLSGINVSRIKTLAFLLCSLSAAVAAIMRVGYAGVSSVTVGQGYEFQSISAVVLGGVAFSGGRGNLGGAIAGALTLQAIFKLMNFLRLPLPIRLTVQGLIIIGAVAFSGLNLTRKSQAR